MDKRELCAYITAQGRTAIECRQVCQRLRELLHTRLQQLVIEYRGQYRGARALRKALSDPRYRDYVEQVVEMCSNAHAARIRYETHLMYYGVL